MISRDAEKLLYLISLYTKSEGELEKWIKNYALWALVYHGIVEKVFENYDYTPVTVMWYGVLRIANISMEAEADIFKLRKEGLINKLRLATSKYRYITAYKITGNGESYLEKVESQVKMEVDRVFNPPGVGVPDITIDAKGNPVLIYKDGRRILVKVLYPEDVAYHSSPSFL